MPIDVSRTLDRAMKGAALARLAWQEDLNFLLTNRVPRIALTRLVGRLSRIESAPLTRAAIACWRLFAELDLSDARKSRFSSLHDCFTRELREGARPTDRRPDVLTSPCDAIVGACGTVERGRVYQAKGMPYAMADLLGPQQRCNDFEGGIYATLRLTSAMYHRFHAPHDATIEHVTYRCGDTWNVNPIALERIERLFCRNTRAQLRLRLHRGGHPLALVPVAAILVASLRLHCIDVRLHRRYRGPTELPVRPTVAKGDELGWFELGSTMIVFAPPGFTLAEGIDAGARIRVGQALMKLPPG